MVKQYDSVSIQKYHDTLARIAKVQFPFLTDIDIDRAIDYSINKRYKEEQCEIHNNYTNKTASMNLNQVTDFMMEKKPILTNWGVMWKPKGSVPAPLLDLVKQFMDLRNEHKREMFKHPKGSELFNRYNLLQNLDKVDVNAIYGCLGMYLSIYYNLHVAASVTAQGRHLTSNAGMCFEMFLANNVKFASLDEVLTFIDNVNEEQNEWKFNDEDILDRNITVDECFLKLAYTCGFEWIPEEEDLNIIWDILNKLPQKVINRLYYKNNLIEFISNSKISKMIDSLLTMMTEPFLNPNEPPECIKDELDVFTEIVMEYVYYHYFILNCVDRMDNMEMSIKMISDTDSTIICLDHWYEYVLNNIAMHKPYTITREKIDLVSFLEGKPIKESLVEFEEPELSYDFYNDQVIEIQKAIDLVNILPQDNLRYSIINILAYILDKVINDYMIRLCKNSNSYNGNCLIIMKNEFLFKRVLLTMVKKNYASIQELQEGNMVPKEEGLDLKGLAIDKSSMNAKTRKQLKQVLFEEILDKENIDQMEVIKKLAILEDQIYKSLQSGNKEYYKPVTIKPMSVYEDPMRIQGIKASVVWNAIKDDYLEAIDLTDRNGIDILKVNINPTNVVKIRDQYPEIYDKITYVIGTETEPSVDVNFKNSYKGSISAVAIPKDVSTPEWLIPFIDYNTIINDNLCNFPLESIGIRRLGKDKVNYTNIVKL